MRTSARALVCALSVSACTPLVDVGSRGVSQGEPGCEGPGLPGRCPQLPWRAGPTPSAETIRGRWRFCGGARHGSPNEAMPRFFGSAGVELSQTTSNGWQVSFLESSVPSTGTAQLDPTTGRLAFTSAEGEQLVWQVTVFEAPRVLRLSALDRWDFVPVE